MKPPTASRIEGRKACPWCGFTSAHVRRNRGGLPYLYCPHCSLLTQAKNGHQAQLLTLGMRPEGEGVAVPTSSTRPTRPPAATWLSQLLKESQCPATP